MAGHSKWASIKHKKAANDAKRSKLWTKILKEIAVAARDGSELDSNPRLRTAVQNAKSSNVPNDTIDRAILKGSGELEGVNYEEIAYEGYGPHGVAIIIEVLTDNKNRTISDLRYILDRNNGNIGEPGSVAWIFDKCGMIAIDHDSIDEEDLFMIAVDAGAEDVKTSGDLFEIITPLENFENVRAAISETDAKISLAEITMLPKTTVELNSDQAKQILRLMDALDDNDDVQKVYANFDIPDDVLSAA